MREIPNQPQRKVRLGMVGGGPRSNIGETHRYAARFDGRYALVAGVFASDAERSRIFAATLGIASDRRYGTWQEMATQEARRASRLWPGHPEGFLAALANIYSDIADAVIARRDGVEADPLAYLFPSVEDGVLGVKFVDAAIESNQRDGSWVDAILDLH